MRYTLMHMNNRVLDMELSNTGNIQKIIEIYDVSHMPYGANARIKNNDSTLLKEWWNNRKIPETRDDYNNVISNLGISSSELLLKNNALSLTDQYWIKPHDSFTNYEDINYFTNEFSSDIGDILIKPFIHKEYINYNSPDSTSNGNLKKRWKIIDGKVKLLKSGTKPYNYEVFNEIIASKIMEILDISHVTYELKVIDNEVYSSCDNFVSYNEDFVSAYMLYLSKHIDNNTSTFNHLMNIYSNLGIKNYKEEINKMLFIDYLIGNTDRHLNNFGVIRNAKTLEFLRIAPIYDSGSSLGFDVPSDKLANITEVNWKPFYSSKYKNQLELIDDFSWLNPNKLKLIMPSIKVLFSGFGNYLSEKRKDGIIKFLESRINNIYSYLKIDNAILDSNLSKLESDIINYIKENNNTLYNINELINNLNKPYITIYRNISSLVKKDILKRVGANKNGYWVIK